MLSLALLGGISLTSAAGSMGSGVFAAPFAAAPVAGAPLSAGPCAATVPLQAKHTPLASLLTSPSTSPLAPRAPAAAPATPLMPGGVLIAPAPTFAIGGVPAGFSGVPPHAATSTRAACATVPADMRAGLLAAAQARRARAASAAPSITLVTKHIPRARPAAPRPAPAPARPVAPPAGAPVTPPASGGPGGPGGITPWTPVPGHPTYAMSDPAGDPYAAQFGVCTWYAGFARADEPLRQMGPANNWPTLAARYGLRTGSTPVAGATVYFAPGVEGSGGHVAHVEQVLGGGWFIVSEMNFYWNGGGWGRVDWRYAYVAPGVTFIY